MAFEIDAKDGTTHIATHIGQLPIDGDFTEDTVRWTNDEGEVILEMDKSTIDQHMPGRTK